MTGMPVASSQYWNMVYGGCAEEVAQDAEGLQTMRTLGRNTLDRFYGKIKKGELSGRKLYFVFQGAAPEKWMLEAGKYTMKRFAALYGLTYGGIATNNNEAAELAKTV